MFSLQLSTHTSRKNKFLFYILFYFGITCILVYSTSTHLEIRAKTDRIPLWRTASLDVLSAVQPASYARLTMDAPKDAKSVAKPGSSGRMIDLSRVIAKEPEKPKRAPHPCVAVVPNRAQATVHFLRKKMARGIALTELEKQLLARFESEADAAVASESLATPVGGAGAGSVSVGEKRKREPEPPVLSMTERMSMSLEEILSKSKGAAKPKDDNDKSASERKGGPKRARGSGTTTAGGSSGRGTGKSRSPAPHRRGR